MGFFGGNDNNDRDDPNSALLDEEMRRNQAELERQRQALFETKIDILKSQGSPSFQADRTPTYKPPKNRMF